MKIFIISMPKVPSLLVYFIQNNIIQNIWFHLLSSQIRTLRPRHIILIIKWVFISISSLLFSLSCLQSFACFSMLSAHRLILKNLCSMVLIVIFRIPLLFPDRIPMCSFICEWTHSSDIFNSH